MALHHHMPCQSTLKNIDMVVQRYSNLEWGNLDIATLLKSSKGQSQKDLLGREIINGEGDNIAWVHLGIMRWCHSQL